jgi:CelD/BcsL family acetyltransferase involved in cellulose biosynthesis
LRYDHVGHDPALNDLSPGTVLQAAAMRDLFGDRFARFDFTEGAGQHKRLFSTGGVDCVDLLLLRPTLANRATLAALSAFDGAMARAKRATRHPALAALAKRVRR